MIEALIAAGLGILFLTSKKKTVGSSSAFRPILRISKDYSKIEGFQPYYNLAFIKKDNDAIANWLRANKERNVFKLTDQLLVKRYGEKVLKSPVYNFLFIGQFTDLAKVLYLYDLIDYWNYDELIFDDIRDWMKQRNLLIQYEDGTGISFSADEMTNEQWIKEILPFFKLYPSAKEKEAKGLATSIFWGSYLQPNGMMYDYVLNSKESKDRFDRFTAIVEEAKKRI